MTFIFINLFYKASDRIYFFDSFRKPMALILNDKLDKAGQQIKEGRVLLTKYFPNLNDVKFILASLLVY